MDYPFGGPRGGVCRMGYLTMKSELGGTREVGVTGGHPGPFWPFWPKTGLLANL